jgi:transcriptional regulator with XRE-family HTH domain
VHYVIVPHLARPVRRTAGRPSDVPATRWLPGGPLTARQTIIAIEQGRYSPSLEMAFQIARVFRVPLDEVFQYPDGEGELR